MRVLARLLALAALATLAGCFFGPRHHTIEPYRSDPIAAAALEQRAADACNQAGHPGGVPARPVVTDGCSAFLDGDWAACCVEHDIPYWCGGTRAARAEADEKLRACVAARRSPTLAFAMKLGVRVGGHPWWPTYWRFGYGRDWPSGYVE